MRRVLLILLVLCCSSSLVAAAEVRIGVLAKRGDERTVTRWQPTAEYLSREVSGHRFRVVPLDFEEIGPAVAAADIDFLLANSGIYVEFEKRYGVGRIATLRNRNGDRGYTRFGGVIFTRAGRDDINTLADLVGKRFAAVKENSLGGYLMAWREMAQQGIVPSEDTTLQFAGTHDAVVDAVLRGEADAGTVRTDTLEVMSREGHIDLARIKVINPQQYPDFSYLCSTRLYPEWPFARLPHTPETLSHAVATALLRMPSDSSAAQAAQIRGWTVPRNYQPVHELMRELRVGPYADLGRITFRDVLYNYWHWLLLTLLILMLLSAATAYVTRLNLRLREAERELLEARDNLTQKVRERTAELEESHRRLERISRDWNDAFDAIRDPIFIHDAEMRIVQANPAYCERAGHSLEQILGRPYYEFFPRRDGPLPACEIFPEQLQQQGDEVQLDSGEVFVSRSFGIWRADNTVQHAIHILDDVTAERRAEAHRRTLSRAVEQTAEGVLILDRNRHVLYCNPGMKRLLERKPDNANEDPTLADVEELVVAHFTEPLRQLFAEAEQNNSASGEMELQLFGRGSKPVFLTVGCIHDEGSEIEGYVLTALDLSEVRRAEQALTFRIGFESVIAVIASRLVNIEPEQLDNEIDDVLRRLGEFAGADRAYLFDYDSEADTISNSHEWCAQGVAPQSASLQQLPLDSFPWLRAKFFAAEAVVVPDVAQLPDEAAFERDEFQREAIRSLLNVPLYYGGNFSGFIGFDNVAQQRDWAEENVRLLRTAGEIIINSLARIRALGNLQQSEASLAAAQHIAHIGNWDWDIVGGTLSWSDEIYRIFGMEPQQFGATYEAFLASVHPDDRQFVVDEVNDAVAGNKEYAIDHRIVRRDGSERIVHEVGAVEFGDKGEALRMIGTVQDVTELRQAERETQRLNRALRTLSLCNTALVHAEQEQTLMEDICNILIGHGGYRFAWVGYVQKAKSRMIRPVAHAGFERGFLDTLRFTWADDANGQHPAGHAVREEATFIARDIAASADVSPWREQALQRGYASVIALPLRSESEVLGVITIDSSEPDAFDQAEQRLLEEMADDLAFGIRTLRSKAERVRAELALKITEERYEELYENAPNAYLSVSATDGSLIQFNQALCDILGYDRETLALMKVFELYADTDDGLIKAKKLFADFKHGKGVRDVELQMHHAAGYPVWVSVSIDPVTNEQGRVVESRSMIIDISARKRAEEERSHFAGQLQRSLLQTIRAIALTIEKRDPYTAGHQERVADLAVAIGREMGLDEQRLEGLRLGAVIHDIGKISVPSEILNRPGRLEPELFRIIQSHPVIGYDIVKEIDFPWPLAKMVVQHHERLNGSGYPKGLKGSELLLESRILMVADVLEAMASHRPYRAALGIDIALREIEKGKGELYDAEVVEACLSLFRDKGMTMEAGPRYT